MFPTLFVVTIIHNQFFSLNHYNPAHKSHESDYTVFFSCRHSRNSCYLFIIPCLWNTSRINVYVNHVQKMCVQILHEFPCSSATDSFCSCFTHISCVPWMAVSSRFSLCSVNIYQSLSVISVGNIVMMFYSDGNSLDDKKQSQNGT